MRWLQVGRGCTAVALWKLTPGVSLVSHLTHNLLPMHAMCAHFEGWPSAAGRLTVRHTMLRAPGNKGGRGTWHYSSKKRHPENCTANLDAKAGGLADRLFPCMQLNPVLHSRDATAGIRFEGGMLLPVAAPSPLQARHAYPWATEPGLLGISIPEPGPTLT